MPNNRTSVRLAGGGAACAALLAFCGNYIASKEGVKTKAYRDPIGIVTACAGETKDVRMGMTFTRAQCVEMLQTRLKHDFGPALETCVPDAKDPAKMKAPTYAAFLSASYNLGSAGFCRSKMARLWNDGDHAGACHALVHYARAGGRVLKGLLLRREDELRLCNAGL